jgi:Na+:H+ antiporter, NhaA family
MTNSTPAGAVRRVVDPVKDFLQTEATGGLFLLGATAVALGWANSPFAAGYQGLWSTELTIGPARWPPPRTSSTGSTTA